MVRASAAHRIGIPIKTATHLADQADGETPMYVVGECHIYVTRGKHVFQLFALVVNKLDVDILAGNAFLAVNDVAVRPAKNTLLLKGQK